MTRMIRVAIPAVAIVLIAVGGVIVVRGRAVSVPTDNDRRFVSAMIPHHHLGMQLIENATSNSDDVRLRRLVFEMDTYHGSELAQLDRWANSWNVVGAPTFPGNIPDDEIEALGTMRGSDHDTQWLALMIDHHEGALDIASPDSGALDVTRSMATIITAVQARQIATMQNLLGELCDEHPQSLGCPDAQSSKR